MGLSEGLVFLLLFLPVSLFILTVYLLSALGHSLGFRRRYVQLLLYVFEYGRKKISERTRRIASAGAGAGEDEVEEEVDDGISTSSESDYQDPSSPSSPLHSCSRGGGGRGGDGDEGEASTDFFELSDIFDFVHSGIEAIVQDQVTQRFASEELKSWNLLTRTNRVHEFISWRLSFMWFAGFLIRYCVLLPVRVTICFLGTSTLSLLTFLIGTLPEGGWKRSLNIATSRFAFRLLSRAFSAIVSYHQREYRPRGGGICVANHTSPIDVVILASDANYSLVVFLTMSTALVGCIPEYYHSLKRRVYRIVYLHAFEFLSWSISAVIKHHDLENKPGLGALSGGGICVANHTSPIDVVVLAVDQCYDMVGQRHGGFLGILQRALARASSHIWFERSEMKDREAVARRLREHVEDTRKLPILIFPEGTCINNSAVMQFKKGSFEVGGIIYPVAIKYDARFGDPFWDSSRYGMVQYLLMMMSSWAIVCDVWYLPPMYRRPGEPAVDFANRVKAQIARKGGLVDLDWDGQLKRAFAKKEWREQQQLEYSKKFHMSRVKSKEEGDTLVPVKRHQTHVRNHSADFPSTRTLGRQQGTIP